MFIGGVNPRASEMDVERFFKGFGRIRAINLKTGYGFVEFEDHRDADDAVYEMNNQTLCGGRITVEHAKGVPRSRNSFGSGGRDYHGGGGGGRDYGSSYGGGRGGRDYDHSSGRDERGGYGMGRSTSKYAPSSRTKHRLIVENVSSRVGWQDLKDLFRPVGEVTFAEVHEYIKGEGVVEFSSSGDLKAAIEKLNGTELMGRKIRLVEEKSRSQSRSRSRSQSRSRSPRSRSPKRHSKSDSVENGNGERRSKSVSPVEPRDRSASRSPE